MSQIHHRACNLCEAICGLAIEHEDGKVVAIRGDKDDPFSRGHLCPKAVALKDVHEDPDRLRRPLRRDGDTWTEVSWDEAFADIGERFRRIQREHGRDALAFCQGNPVLHNYGASIYAQSFLPWALRTRNRFSSTSVDNLPRMLVSRFMYGNQAVLAVPDVDRTQHMLVIGANPLASNGSIMTAPDIGRRLADLRARGGRLVVIDPRRTETAEVADEHHFIRPGRDVSFLLGFLHVLLAERLRRPDGHELPVRGIATIQALVAEFPPEVVSPLCGIAADDIRRLARDFGRAPSAVCYGRMGVSVQEFGLLATWLIEVVNLVTGNLDRPGGYMLSKPAVDLVAIANRTGQPGSFDRYRSRVRQLPEFNGELPIATLADEIETPGPGQVRAMLITAHNPVLSSPDGHRLDRALAGLDFMVAVDIYLNETTRHAHYILPPTAALEHDHYDMALHAFGVRNTARWNPPLFAPAEGALHDWQIYLRLCAELVGPTAGRVVRALGATITPRRLVDAMLRTGPYRLSVARLEKEPHGLDLGPLAPRLAELLATDDGAIDLAPDVVTADLPRLRARVAEWQASAGDALVLIGRRDLRSNNSWMHNSLRLVKGKPRCTLFMHPRDAERLGLESGRAVRIRSRAGAIEAPLQVTDAVMPGVVSLPHGWGHGRPRIRLGVAARHPGTSFNDLTDGQLIDAACGTSVLNGVPVEVSVA